MDSTPPQPTDPEPLITRSEALCRRLAPHGWGDLLARHGLDIGASDLRGELLRDLPHIDRTVPGFEDFAAEGRRGIEPGNPARSLLFHALASPNVVSGSDGRDLEAFPTGHEIEVIEDLVFGIAPPSLVEIAARFPNALLAIMVFATEYRPAIDTVHRRHADLCFARTGVARVGTSAPRYDPRNRGFLPFVDGDDHAIRVLPAAYAPYLAVQLLGDRGLFGPMNFNLVQDGDETRHFWVPLHKLFAGPECLRGLDLGVALETRHLNEKLRRMHRELGRTHDTGWREPDIDAVPFVFGEGIAQLATDTDERSGLLVPVPHDPLVQPAQYRGEPLTFVVPPEPDNQWSPSLTVPAAANGARRAPEYVHARHALDDEGAVRDLNDVPDVADQVATGGYRALHYVDFTGDGWVEAVCPELATQVPRNIPAYSLVTAPDFYPATSQRELVEWWLQRVPRALREAVWETPPLTLSDHRMAPNIQLPGARFRAEDTTPTAIVTLPIGERGQRPLVRAAGRRSPHLPDAASSVFAPGWDTSRDELDGVTHLAAYGLGSPFPEDAKLCAALSSFWPAVAPDSGRSFSQPFPTVSPLDDAELGSVGALPWDGIEGPRSEPAEEPRTLRYASFDHVDYVDSALEGRFSLALTGQVDTEEYTARILATLWAHRLAGVDRGDRSRRVVSFRGLAADDDELQEAEREAGATLPGARYRLEFALVRPGTQLPADHRHVLSEVGESVLVMASTLPRALVKAGGDPWELRTE